MIFLAAEDAVRVADATPALPWPYAAAIGAFVAAAFWALWKRDIDREKQRADELRLALTVAKHERTP
jgi:hypothetical protein